MSDAVDLIHKYYKEAAQIVSHAYPITNGLSIKISLASIDPKVAAYFRMGNVGITTKPSPNRQKILKKLMVEYPHVTSFDILEAIPEAIENRGRQGI